MRVNKIGVNKFPNKLGTHNSMQDQVRQELHLNPWQHCRSRGRHAVNTGAHCRDPSARQESFPKAVALTMPSTQCNASSRRNNNTRKVFTLSPAATSLRKERLWTKLEIVSYLTFCIEIIVTICVFYKLQLKSKTVIAEEGDPVAGPRILLWCTGHQCIPSEHSSPSFIILKFPIGFSKKMTMNITDLV